MRFFHLSLCLIAITAFAGAPSASAEALRILTYNIKHARGMDGEVSPQRIARVINSVTPDLVGLQEVDRGVERSGRIDIPAILAEATGLNSFFKKNIDHQGGEYGNAILSRFPVVDWRNHHYEMLHEGEQRGALISRVDFNGQELIFITTHLDYRPDPQERLSNIEEIFEILDENEGTPVILCGDINARPDTPTVNKLKTRFADVWDSASEGNGSTYPSDTPYRRIDYIFFYPQNAFAVNSIKVIDSDASDHLPYYAELTLIEEYNHSPE